MSEHRPSAGSHRLPREVSTEIWARLLRRLEAGEVLITNDRFQEALESEYTAVTGKKPSENDRRSIRRMVDNVNERFPQTYMAHGVQNCVKRVFEKAISRLQWDTARIQETGVKSLRRFSRADNMRDLLDDFNIDLDTNSTMDMVKGAVDSSENRRAALAAQQRPKPAFELPDLEAAFPAVPDPPPKQSPIRARPWSRAATRPKSL